MPIPDWSRTSRSWEASAWSSSRCLGCLFSADRLLGRVEAAHDLQQLVDTVRAGMPLQNGLQAMAREAVRQLSVEQNVAHVLSHLFTVARDEIVGSRAEQLLRIVPRRRQQRNAARERLEHSNGRDSAESFHVGA